MVSVLIVNYNGAKFLKDAIFSFNKTLEKEKRKN
jgi:GT2 family glycosyltransferase